MTFLRSHISIFILLLFILCSNYIFGQDLKGNNVILPATNSTVGSIKIGSWNALNMYGIKNIYVGNSGNFNSPASDSNVAIGYGALRVINNASRNVAVGPYAGGRIVNADGNVWIGNEAGNDSTFRNIDNIGGIDNSDTICPLIYFDFENNQVRICGTLDVNNGITGIDSVLWYLNGDTIINKSRHLVTIDSGLFLPHPQSNTRLGYVLAWEHTNGRVFPVEISQLSDTVTEVGVGYWTLDSLNGIIYLNDTNWYTRLMTLGVDEITSFTHDLETHYDINCDTVFVDTTQGFYEFNYSDQSVSITGNEFNYDIEIGDRIYIYFHCVSSMPGCDTNFYLTPKAYFDVDLIDYNETFDSVTYIGEGMVYYPCQSDMCSYDQELVYKMGYIKCDDSVATTTYPVTINDNVIILGDTIKIPNLIEDTTNKIIYYNEADGRISYGETSNDTSFWQRRENYLYPKNLPDSVGIGTATPIERLDVQNGNINLDTTSAASGQITQNGEAVFHTYSPNPNRQNLWIGGSAGNFTTTGTWNLAIGQSALMSATDCERNLAIGYNSMYSNTGGSMNLAIGRNSLKNNSTGYYNLAVGEGTLEYNTTGQFNLAIGNDALTANVANHGSLAIGYNAMYYADDRASGRWTYNTAIGHEAMKGSTTAANNTGRYNTAVGYQALDAMTSCNHNTAFGYDALGSNAGGHFNVAIGSKSLALNSTNGNNNIGIGYQSLDANVDGSANIAIGVDALGTINGAGGTSSHNIAIGYYSMGASTDNNYYNVGIGSSALSNNVGGNNVAIGYSTASNAVTSDNNVIVGSSSGLKLNTGDNNVFIGLLAGDSVTSGSGNILIGSEAGGKITTESNKLYIENSNADSNNALIFGNFATDKLRINGTLEVETLPEQSAPYLVGWDNTTKQLTAIDSTGVVFQSETGFYQEELSATKTIFNLGFTITNNALVSLNGTIINPSQWTGIGTSTLTLLLDTQQYDLFTIKQ